jgi:hypothetical protein
LIDQNRGDDYNGGVFPVQRALHQQKKGCVPIFMVVALKYKRNSIGVEIDPEYCRMTAAYLKAESNDLFSDVQSIFEKAEEQGTAWVVRENQELYEVKPARKKLQ